MLGGGEELIHICNDRSAVCPGPPLPAQIKCPSRAPDATWEDVISPEQALLYRLSGDYNPLHADPDIAGSVGFERPILHGLCTYGHAARAVLLSFSPGEPQALRSITVSPLPTRFSFLGRMLALIVIKTFLYHRHASQSLHSLGKH